MTKYTITCDDGFWGRIDWYVEWTNKNGANESWIFITKEDAEKFIEEMAKAYSENTKVKWKGRRFDPTGRSSW